MKHIFIFGLVLILLSSFVLGATVPDPTGTVAYYTMDNDDISGSELTDITDNNNHGDISASVTTGDTGILGEALDFTGNDGNNVSIDDVATDLDGSSESTFSFWAKWDSQPVNARGLISFDDGIGDNYIRIETREDGTDQNIHIVVRNEGKTKVNTDFALIDDRTNFHHVVIAFGDANIKVYVDGEPEDTYSTSYWFDNTNMGEGAIGNFNYDPERNFPGTIDEVAFFDYELTSDEIEYLYNSGSPKEEQQWDFTSVSPFELTAYEFWDNSTIDSFTVDVTNTSGTYTISTTDGTVYIKGEDTVDVDYYNLGGDNDKYFNRSFEDINISTNLNTSFWQGKLIFDGYDSLNDTDVFDINVTIDDGTLYVTNESNSTNKSTFLVNAGSYDYTAKGSFPNNVTGSTSLSYLEIQEILINFTLGDWHVYGPFNSTEYFNIALLDADCDVNTYMNISPNTTSSVELNEDGFHVFDENINGFYLFIDSSSCSWVDIETTDEPSPNITSTTPSYLNFTITETDVVDFNVTADSGLDLSFSWLLDGIQQVITQAWRWVTGYTDEGERNVTIVVEDEYGRTDTRQFNVTVLNINIVPEINDLYVSRELIYQNVPYDIYCNATDTDNSSEILDIEIQYDDGSGWQDTTENFVSGNLWRSTIPLETHSEGDVVSYRCRATDVDLVNPLTSDWYVLDEHRTISFAQTPPTPPQLFPKGSKYKYNIPYLCAGSNDNQSDVQKIYYEISMRKNNTGGWKLLMNQSGFALGSLNIQKDGFNTTYDFRCRATDLIESSEYVYSYNASIKRNMAILDITKTGHYHELLRGRPYQFNLYADVESLDNIGIVSSYVDCNGDGLYEYYDSHPNRTMVKKTYTCINSRGKQEHVFGVELYKNTTDDWEGVCQSISGDENTCSLQKRFEAMVR